MAGLIGNADNNTVLDNINAYWNVINNQAAGTLDLLKKWNGTVEAPAPVVVPSTVNDTANDTTETNLTKIILWAGTGLAIVAAGIFIFKKI